jgi:hypothetical protein
LRISPPVQSKSLGNWGVSAMATRFYAPQL